MRKIAVAVRQTFSILKQAAEAQAEMERQLASLKSSCPGIYNMPLVAYIMTCPRSERPWLRNLAYNLAFQGYKTDEILSRIKLPRHWSFPAKLMLMKALK